MEGDLGAARVKSEHPQSNALQQSITTLGLVASAAFSGSPETLKIALQHETAAPANGLCGSLGDGLEVALELDAPNQFERPEQIENVRSLLSHGANVNQRYKSLATPILLASRGGSHQLVQCLLDAGADWTAADQSGQSILHHAALSPSPGIFASLSRRGASLHVQDIHRISPFHLAMTQDIFTALVLNSDWKMEPATQYPWSILADGYAAWIGKGFRSYQRRFGETLLQRVANLQPKGRLKWSPLCLMSVVGNTTAMENLLRLGALLDGEGSPDGSALMLACVNRRLESVKLLLRRGTSLSYVSHSLGRRISCLDCARGSATITRWLLVDRFTDQRKIANDYGQPSSQGLRERSTYRPWSGIAKSEFIITGIHERDPSESSSQYFTRLQRLRRDMRGRQVPPSATSGGRTCRPSRLVPVEKVRIHPDDGRAPQETAQYNFINCFPI